MALGNSHALSLVSPMLPSSSSHPSSSSPASPVDHPSSPLIQSSPSPLPIHTGNPSTPPPVSLSPDVDPQIIEALRSKDRIYVLKLGETFEALIMERRTRVELFPSTSYQRLLVHRCSAYYRLTPETDPSTKALFVLYTSDSRIPDRRICELVPAESTAQPAFKIMRRSVPERRSKPTSHASSVAGEDVELSDVEPSESGSLGGRSNVTTSSTKKRMTIEEREAAYNEARSRIFMDFEKEKGRDKDNSSTSPSLNGSASAGGRSSVSDTDDATSSPATESEWSAPSTSHSRDKRDGRRGGSMSGSSNRSLRNTGSYHLSNSGGSSRNSRAPSPSFNYASIHDPSNAGHIYDPSQHHNPTLYYPSQYAYPYSPPGQGPNPPFLTPYPYYAPPYNHYQSPPPVPQHSHSDPQTATSASEPYHAPHQMNYAPPYGWPPHPSQPPLQSPPHGMHMPVAPQHPPQNPPQQMGPPPPLPPQSPQYQPYMQPPPHGYGYPLQSYYPPAPQPPPQGHQMPPGPPPMNMQQQPPQPQPLQHNPGYDIPRNPNGNQMGNTPNGQFGLQNGNGPRGGLGNGVIQPNSSPGGHSRGPGANNNGSGINNGKRAQVGRSAWSYGPGVGNGGYPNSAAGSDAVGPRFHGTRHASGQSSSGNSRSSHSDDVSSTSSSTTSSSSRRTYTSTTSSQQHPLPARPDWAVGLKAQPTLAAMGGGRHHINHDHNSRTMSPMSPSRSSGHNSPMSSDHHHHHSPRQSSSGQQHSPSVILQPTDFPPLTPAAGAEKRTPIATGAWGQSRPVLSPTTNGNINANASTAASPGSSQQSPVSKQDENGRASGGSAKAGELYSPKLVRRPPGAGGPVANGQGHQRSQSDRGGKEVTANNEPVSALAGQVSSMTLGEEAGAMDAAAPASADSASASVPSSVVASPPAVSSPSV